MLAGIEALTIFADNDEKGTGQRAAYKTHARWIAADRECRIALPPTTGRDWNDEIWTGRGSG